ncbi:unnamed protein product [Lathyrus oleraceus]
MFDVTSVSYRFNINGFCTTVLQAKRGIRQGDPLSPLLFVIIMEYMNKLLRRMQKKNTDFNRHAKCERLHITNLAFADDVIIFARGDCKSMELMMEALNQFSKSNGLIVNPRKCRVYSVVLMRALRMRLRG